MPVAQVLLWLKDSSNGELVMPLRRILRKQPPASPALTTVEPPAAVLTAPAPIRELLTRGQLITVTPPNHSTSYQSLILAINPPRERACVPRRPARRASMSNDLNAVTVSRHPISASLSPARIVKNLAGPNAYPKKC